jgi:hypothetical protein
MDFISVIAVQIYKKKSNGLAAALFMLVERMLFLSCLVSLIEHINTAGGIDNLGLAGVEGVRCVGNLDLYERILDTVDGDGLLGGGATPGDEDVLV